MRISVLMATALVAGLTGCSLAPTYHRPASGIGPTWPTGTAYSSPTAASAATVPAADIGWQAFFTDPQLRELIDVALKNNRNLRVAILNVEKAQYLYRIQRSPLFPSLDASGNDTVQHLSSRSTGSTGHSNSGGTFRNFSAGIGFTSYELDFFGRIRSLDEEALQQFFSTEEARKTAQITLVSQVADAYLTYLSDRRLLALAHETYTSQQASLKLTQQSFDAGVDTALDLSQAQQAVDSARADIASFTREVAQDRNALQLLLGAPLPTHLADNTSLRGERFLETLPAGLPSDLLTRRPDILAAEHTLKAANANIGAARAAFFPSISLTGSFGTASSQLSGLFANGSEQWTFAPTISLPIFNGGANVAN
ncbi:MAG TPA: efflux transporter outer membrane subunit, partial [Nevskiaceae bacterium]|nr:efflux transporter outer membrane subunit [Nevskiaceae bacterium]